MKKLVSLLLAVTLMALSLASCGEVKSKNPSRPDDIPMQDTTAADLSNATYNVVTENDKLKFEFNEHTTDIKITDKSNGYVWTTEKTADDGTVTRGNVFTLDYYNTSGSSTVSTFSSSADSVEKGQFRFEYIDNGVKVTYGVGDISFTVKCPLQIVKSRADKFIEKMTEDQKYTFESYYKLVSFDAKTAEEYPTAEIYTSELYSADEIEALKKQYPDAVKEPCYYPSSRIDYYAVAELNPLFQSLGYTDEDAAIDNASTSTAMTQAEFKITMYYTLNGGKLTVRMPESEMYNPETYIIDNLKLHPALADFAAAQQGYFLLPDGSGSVMNFTNGKDVTRSDPVYINMYGVDPSRSIAEKTAYYNDPVFPVYGVCVKNGEQKNGLFAIIESGDAFAGITARSSDASRTRNVLYPEFRISEKSTLESFGSDSEGTQGYTIYQFQRYLGDITVSYNFLNGESSEYSGMAKVYEQYLFGSNLTETQTKDYYSTIDLIGSVRGVANFLGVGYNTDIPLTTYEEAQTIIKDLNANGMTNMNVKYEGWTNGGITHGYVDNAKTASVLGGEDGFKALLQSAADLKVGLYPDAEVQYVMGKNPSKSDRTENLDRTDGAVLIYDDLTFQPYTGKFYRRGILNMNALKNNLNGYLGVVSGFGLKTVSLGQMGKQVNANYKRTEDYLERQETLENLEAIMKEKSEAGYSVMGTAGIGKLGKYMSVINSMPIKSAGYDKCDYSVPFVAMVYSGHVDYTGDAINLSNNDRKDLLRLIENGAGAQFTLTGTYYDELYATTAYDKFSTVYSEIKESVLEDYNYLKTAMKNTYGQKITNHRQLASGVFETTFANGVKVTVNYNRTAYKSGSLSVDPLGYTLTGGAN